MDRRIFIQQSCTACLAGSALVIGLGACTPTRYASGKLGKDGINIDINDFREEGNDRYRLFIVVRNEALQFPIYVYRFSATDYSALWMQCTHQGAELQASGDRLQCAAHGSEFDNKGTVKTGPASRNLRNFPVKMEGNQLFIDLRAV